MNNKEFGSFGEKQALNYLMQKGYTILDTNYRTYFGEIDIIAQEKDTVVFTEVKTRASLKYGLPREAVNFHKQVNYTKLALQYLQFKKLSDRPSRFDVIEVYVNGNDYKINHIINAFDFTRI